MSTTADPVADPGSQDEQRVDDATRLSATGRLGRAVLVTSFIVVAVAGAVLGIHSRERDDAFLQRQAHPAVVDAADVEKAVQERTSGTASCRPGDAVGALRNPWRCRVRERGGRVAGYTVRINVRGGYSGAGTRRFRGCCIPVPIAD